MDVQPQHQCKFRTGQETSIQSKNSAKDGAGAEEKVGGEEEAASGLIQFNLDGGNPRYAIHNEAYSLHMHVGMLQRVSGMSHGNWFLLRR